MILGIVALEQSLRRRFAVVNQCPQMLCANVLQYYSTLDGFGQRSKHQLLLDPEVRPELGGGANALMGALPAGALAACLDLFLLSAGPGLRGKLSHGEATLLPAHTALLPSREGETPSTILPTIRSLQQCAQLIQSLVALGNKHTASCFTPCSDGWLSRDAHFV
jgi:hypothetical protein